MQGPSEAGSRNATQKEIPSGPASAQIYFKGAVAGRQWKSSGKETNGLSGVILGSFFLTNGAFFGQILPNHDQNRNDAKPLLTVLCAFSSGFLDKGTGYGLLIKSQLLCQLS
jgi:hypothetical protein